MLVRGALAAEEIVEQHRGDDHVGRSRNRQPDERPFLHRLDLHVVPSGHHPLLPAGQGLGPAEPVSGQPVGVPGHHAEDFDNPIYAQLISNAVAAH